MSKSRDIAKHFISPQSKEPRTKAVRPTMWPQHAEINKSRFKQTASPSEVQVQLGECHVLQTIFSEYLLEVAT